MESRNVPDSEDWDDLVGAVRRRRCVVMLGSHAVTARFDKGVPPEPLPGALAHFLYRRLEREGVKPPERAETSTLAQEAYKLVGRAGLEDWIRRFHARQEGHVDPTVRALAELPLGIVINTVPGLPLEKAIAERHPGVATGVYDRNGPATDLLESWSDDEPLVYHLYGSTDRPGSLAVTDSDLLDVLVSVVGSDPPLPANLLSALRDQHRTYLFLGFRLYHWQQRILMRVLDEATDRPRRTSGSLAFETDEIYDGTRSFFTRGHGINFFTDMAPDEFVAELHRRVVGTVTTTDDAGDGGRDLAASVHTPYPQKIFICHASEDATEAAAIASRLREGGLKPWIDHDDLRGGDRWEAMIQSTLDNDVRYVVVVRSEHLARKRGIESFVNQEIDVALRRSRRFGRSQNALRFVIPIRIDGDRSPDTELDDIQAIDYTADDGADRLVSVIRRDIQEEMARG